MDKPAASSQMLIGHSGPVYALSFSPSTTRPDPAPPSADNPSTHPRYLLSSSADKSIRLWLIDAFSCLVVYKGHDAPVWDLSFGPFGHYFVSGGHDRTAKLWSTDHIAALRSFVGHDSDVDVVGFHPNNAYVFTGSSDRSVRMWAVATGEPVRLFTGHTGNVTALACAPDGKTLASADDHGSILLWDLASGRRTKRMRGHGKGGIWSLSWTVESSLLISGGMDGTVRVWDVLRVTGSGDVVGGKVVAEGGAGTKVDAQERVAAATATATAAMATEKEKEGGKKDAGGGEGSAAAAAAGTAGVGGGKKKGKEVVVSPEQISAFPTKKSPVYKVMVTRQNLVIAGGAYLP
jgi:transcription initiation factor TFIID subunit 5